jgi:hypothetical protein
MPACSADSMSIIIIALSKDLVCLEYSIVSLAASDHFPVTARIKSIRLPKPCPVIKRNYKKVDIDDLGIKIKAIELPDDDTTSVNVLLNSWHFEVTNLLDTVAPFQKLPYRKKSLPCMNKDLRKMIAHQHSTARRIVKHPSLVSEADHAVLHTLKRKVKSQLRYATKQYGTKVLKAHDHKTAWNFIRSTTFTSSKGPTTPVDITKMNDYMATVVQSTSPSDLEAIMSCDTESCFKLTPVNESEVEKFLIALLPIAAPRLPRRTPRSSS